MVAAGSEHPHQKRFTLIRDNNIVGENNGGQQSRMITLNGDNYFIWK